VKEELEKAEKELKEKKD